MTPYYEQDGITIYHGDCREVMPFVRADVVVTDPPYGVGFSSGWSGRSIIGDDSTAVRDAMLALWGDRSALVFGHWSIPKPVTTNHCLIWQKGQHLGMGDLSLPWGNSTEEIYVLGNGFTGRRVCNVLVHRSGPRAEKPHPHMKPPTLMLELISRCPAGIVLDPFMGTGTTLVAAKRLGRKAIGIEIEERYCEMAATRLAQGALDFFVEATAHDEAQNLLTGTE